jgi:23S rRNA (uracil1939-C5)-methyltransferase
LRRADGAAHLGFAERGSHRIVDLEACPVLVPDLEALLPALRALAGAVLPPGGRADFRLTASETGVELAIRADLPLTLGRRELLAAFAAEKPLARVAWGDEIVVERAAPVVRFGGVAVTLPPAPFLQATEAGERALVAVARSAVGVGSRIADLFCGAGAFALPLSEHSRVHALDADGPAIDALKRAAAQARRPLVAERRDLFRRPLEPDELDMFDAVVLDPPRAGARAQVERLAASRVPVVAMASCNPGTFARDARILADGGYRLESVTPVDQFLWSAEVELAAILRRD